MWSDWAPASVVPFARGVLPSGEGVCEACTEEYAGGGGGPPIGSPAWCGSHRTHVHQGCGIAPNQVEGEGVMVGRQGDHEARVVGSARCK